MEKNDRQQRSFFRECHHIAAQRQESDDSRERDKHAALHRGRGGSCRAGRRGGASPENLPHRNAAKGDIVLFRVNNHFILHRILEFDANGVAVIQGDGILRAKEHCGRDGIFGRVVSVLKQGKHPVDVESNGYRLKIRLWLMAAPFRRILLGVWRRLFLTSARKA